MHSAAHREIIRRPWPALVLWPINEPPFRPHVEQLLAENDRLSREITRLQAELAEVRRTIPFQLGDMLIQAVCEPGRNTVLLPYRLIRLTREALGKHDRRL